MNKVNAAIKEYGLQFKEVERKLEMLIISDTMKEPLSNKKGEKQLIK
ncbi:hypothetical protein [Pedobacter sp. NJ-S-72]